MLLFYVLVFWPRGMWDLSSLSRNQTCTPCVGRWSLNHWTARDVLGNWLEWGAESRAVEEVVFRLKKKLTQIPATLADWPAEMTYLTYTVVPNTWVNRQYWKKSEGFIPELLISSFSPCCLSQTEYHQSCVGRLGIIFSSRGIKRKAKSFLAPACSTCVCPLWAFEFVAVDSAGQFPPTARLSGLSWNGAAFGEPSLIS